MKKPLLLFLLILVVAFGCASKRKIADLLASFPPPHTRPERLLYERSPLPEIRQGNPGT